MNLPPLSQHMIYCQGWKLKPIQCEQCLHDKAIWDAKRLGTAMPPASARPAKARL
jgi:hypothetical protein